MPFYCRGVVVISNKLIPCRETVDTNDIPSSPKTEISLLVYDSAIGAMSFNDIQYVAQYPDTSV